MHADSDSAIVFYLMNSIKKPLTKDIGLPFIFIDLKYVESLGDGGAQGCIIDIWFSLLFNQ